MSVEALKSPHQYTEIPERGRKAIEGFIPDEERIKKRVEHFAHVKPRKGDHEGETEVIDGVTFTHHFVTAPGDAEYLTWHYVEAGSGEPIVFLHGIPDSWYQWHPQMAALASTHRCIAVDLKGYGQSDKRPGDYRHEGASEQLFAMLRKIGLTRFNVVTHDRGTVQADFIAANHPDWDCCVEVMDLEESFPWTPKDNRLERNLAPVSALSPHVPAAAALGYHLCYGTLGGWPMVEPKNLSMTVKFANGAVARSGRRVDFIHIPILDTEDESYFAPLRELDVGDTKIYFGTIHDLGRKDSIKRRLEILRKYVPEFGLAAPCGLGRHKPDEIPELLHEHVEALHFLTHGLHT